MLVFSYYVGFSLDKERMLKYKYDERLVYSYFEKMEYDLSEVLGKLSKHLSNSNVSGNFESRVFLSWGLIPSLRENLNLSYYDADGRYHQSQRENPFSVKYDLSRNTVAKYKSTLQGGGFTYCEVSCQYYYLRPALNNKFDKGVLQLSYPYYSILNDLVSELPSPNTVLLRWYPEKNSYALEEASSIYLYERVKKYFSEISNDELFFYDDDDEVLVNFVRMKGSNGLVFVVVHDASALQKNFSDLYYGYFYISTITLIVILAAFILFFKVPIRRINQINKVLAIIGEGHFSDAQVKLKRSQRSHVYDELDMIHGATLDLAGQLDSMHEELKLTNQRLVSKVDEVTFLAYHDALTGLYNRLRFNQELKVIYEKDDAFFLISLDMDHFKLVNDSMGHQAGDQLLKQCARILQDAINNCGVVGRLGGDEFAIVFPGKDRLRVAEILEQIAYEVRRVQLDGDDVIVKVGISIGVAAYPDDSTSLGELASFADAAMYENKRFKQNSFNYYTGNETLIKEEQEALYWNRVVQESLAESSLQVVFQPIIPQKGGGVLGYEVLSRLLRDEGLISPNSYIHHLEKNKSIIQYDRFVFDLALKTGSEQLKSPRLMINFSYSTIASVEIVKYVLGRIKCYNYPAYNVVFEITERAEITDFSKVYDFIHTLKRYGLGFSIDDFGAGFSSFFYLTQLPIDYLKIDKKIVAGLLNNPVDHHVVESILLLTKNLNIKVIAEGIETFELRELMLKYDIDFLQGYHILAPVTVDELQRLQQQDETYAPETTVPLN